MRPLLGDRRFFQHTEILTPMVVTAHGTTAVVLFTENGGDPKLNDSLRAVAARFSYG